MSKISCPICMESVCKTVSTETECKHTFCTSCINKWLETKISCPMCRHQLKEDPNANSHGLTIDTTTEAIISFGSGNHGTHFEDMETINRFASSTVTFDFDT